MRPIALLLPGLSFLIRKKRNAGIFCIVLQLTLIGWIPAAAWAYSTLDEDMKKHKVEKILRSIKTFPTH